MAVECNHPKIVASLMDKNPDFRTSFVGGEQLIHIAVRKGWLNIVKAIIEKEPQLLEQIDDAGKTPLFRAAIKGHADIVDYLLSKEADPKTTLKNPDSKHNGKTAFQRAVELGHECVVKSLLNQDPTLIDCKFSNLKPIHSAARNGHLKIVQFFLEKFPALLEQTDNYGQTPLLWAAAKGHAHVVDYLLSQNANFKVTTKAPGVPDGRTPFLWAIENRNAKVVALLACKISLSEEEAKKLLEFTFNAVEKNDIRELELIIDNNPSILEKTDSLNQTLLHCAAAKGHTYLVKYLLKKGANPCVKINHPNCKDNGKIPLLLALDGVHKEAVDALLKIEKHNNAYANSLLKGLHEHQREIANSFLLYRYEAKVDKLVVLKAAERYLCDKFTKEQFETIRNTHPQYEDCFQESKCKMLIDKVLQFKENENEKEKENTTSLSKRNSF